jgi:hypothetical protein
MSALAVTPSGRRGTELLLRHCAALSGPSATAAERLHEELGGDFATRLIAALVPRQRDERRLRGSSSP